jgi:hypothetical protein
LEWRVPLPKIILIVLIILLLCLEVSYDTFCLTSTVYCIAQTQHGTYEWMQWLCIADEYWIWCSCFFHKYHAWSETSQNCESRLRWGRSPGAAFVHVVIQYWK